MKTHFVHNNPDRNLIKFMKNACDVCESYKSYLMETGDAYIYQNAQCKSQNDKLKMAKNSVHILLITEPLITIVSSGFDFYLPINPTIYYHIIDRFQYKMLLPLNIYSHREYTWGSYYCPDILFRKYKREFSENNMKREGIRRANVALYLDINELKKINKIRSSSFLSTNLLNRSEENLYKNFNLMKLFKRCAHTEHILNKSRTIKFMGVVSYDTLVGLKKGTIYYIYRNGYNTYKKIKIHHILNNFMDNGLYNVSFKINGKNDNEFSVLFMPNRDMNITLPDILMNIDYHDKRNIGINSKALGDKDIYDLYWHYGKNRMYQMFQHLSDISHIYFDLIINYVNKIPVMSDQMCNKDKFIRVFAFWCGKCGHEYGYKSIVKYMDKNPQYFVQKNVMLISRSMISYGGNQKTTVQCYKDLIMEGYDVKIGCIKDECLMSDIDKHDVLVFSDINKMIRECAKNKYEKIIVNKLDEYASVTKKIDKKCVFITHNHMDPINDKLRVNRNIGKILTINQYHQSAMYENICDIPVGIYNNHQPLNRTKIDRDSFSYNLTYIGRISKEKNVDILVEAFKIYSKKNPNATLTIIGDGKNDRLRITHPKIVLTGRLDFKNILQYLAKTDYVVSCSCTEGIPFTFMEAMSMGIPVITSNIVGCNEIILDGETGFKFDLVEYNNNKEVKSKWKSEWKIFDVIELHRRDNIRNVVSAIQRAYNVSISNWKHMSNNCYNFVKERLDPYALRKRNMDELFSLNNVLIVCADTEELYMKQFPFVDFCEVCPNTKKYKHDIVLNLSTFDIIIKHLSLLMGRSFVKSNIESMMLLVSRLYKLRREMIDLNLSRLSDRKGNWINFSHVRNNNSVGSENENGEMIVKDVCVYI